MENVENSASRKNNNVDSGVSILDLSGIQLVPEKKNDVLASFTAYVGSFKKYSAQIDGKHFLIKPKVRDFPEISDIEYSVNYLANYLGINVGQFYKAKLNDGSFAFGVDNFVLNSNDDFVVLEHFSKFIDKNDDKAWSCENIIKVIKENSKTPDSDVENFVKITLFDSIVGNIDRHSQNIAFLRTKNELSLSPFYDNVSWVFSNPDLHAVQDVALAGKVRCLDNNDPLLKDYLLEFKRLGLGSACKKFMSKVKKADIDSVIDDSQLSGPSSVALKRLIKKNIGEI